MRKFLMRMVVVAALFIGGAASSFSQPIDIDKCKSIIEMTADSKPSARQISFMIEQCRIVADIYMAEANRIKKIPTVQGREDAADEANRAYANEYRVYERMMRILKGQLRSDNAALGRLNAVEIEHLANDDKYINQLFTIFRSGYELQ